MVRMRAVASNPVSESLDIPCFAKVNLALAVAPPEPARLANGESNPKAGWHRICSLFSCIQLSDSLVIRRKPAGPSSFNVRWAPDAPSPSAIEWPIEKDLIVKAHAGLEAELGRTFPVDAELIKRIPVGGGLGGGSADAAGMLRALDRLFGLDLGAARLASIGARFGSDIPFFIDRDHVPARPALVEGFGERCRRRERIVSDLILICPRLGCPTPEVYRAFDRWLAEQPRFEFREAACHALLEAPVIDPAALLNDLAEPAFRVAPALRQLHEAARRVTPWVHVTGSGSAMFCLPNQASQTATRLSEALGTHAAVIHTRLC